MNEFANILFHIQISMEKLCQTHSSSDTGVYLTVGSSTYFNKEHLQGRTQSYIHRGTSVCPNPNDEGILIPRGRGEYVCLSKPNEVILNCIYFQQPSTSSLDFGNHFMPKRRPCRENMHHSTSSGRKKVIPATLSHHLFSSTRHCPRASDQVDLAMPARFT